MRIVLRTSQSDVASNGVALQSELLEAVRLLDRNRLPAASADVFQESIVIALERDSDSRRAIDALTGAGFRVSSF